MKFAGSQNVISCKEHEEVNVPFRLLLGDDGQLDLYPEIATKGYFDIDYYRGKLALRSRGFVGLIPISDRVAIHVEPRAPIGNLLYMIWRAGLRLEGLERFIRGYQFDAAKAENIEELYVSAFISAMKAVARGGLYKKYRHRDTDIEKRNRLLLAPTVSRYRAAGLRHKHVFQVHDLTPNNRENQILKRTLSRLAQHFVRDPTGANHEIALTLRTFLNQFWQVDDTGLNDLQIARETIPLIRGLPRSHRYYEPALWLSYLIATRSGVVMEKVGRAQFESLIINVADVFEHYVRRLLQEAASADFDNCIIFDGNVNSVPLFATSRDYQTHPDYYFYWGTRFVAVADAKYKPKVSTEDRYALLTFASALDVDKAAFICPSFDANCDLIHQGVTRSGIEVRLIRINLCASDLAAEELEFRKRVAIALNLGRRETIAEVASE